MRLKQIREILAEVAKISGTNQNAGILVAINNSEMTDSELTTGLDAMSDNDFSALITEAKSAFSISHRVKQCFESLDELQIFKDGRNTGSEWIETGKTCVYEYPQYN